MTAKERYKKYLEGYCRTYRVTPKEAEKHATVREVKRYFEMEGQTESKHGNRSI